MNLEFLSGVLSTSGVFTTIAFVIRYFNDRKKNNAIAMKTEAEAEAIEFKTATEGWQHLAETLQKIGDAERKYFGTLIDNERKECDDKLQSMQNQINLLKQKLNN